MSTIVSGILIWLSIEYIGIAWEIFKGRLSYTPLAIIVGISYQKFYGFARWTKIRLDAPGILGHLLICNIILMLSSPFWQSSSVIVISWGILLLLFGSISQLVENLAWSRSGLDSFFQSWENLKPHLFAGGETMARQREQMKNEIKNFSPSRTLPYILGRIGVTVLIVTLNFTIIYQQLLILNPVMYTDISGNPITSGDFLSLVAYSLNLTTHGDSGLTPTTGTARLVRSLHSLSNTFLFALLISAVLVTSQEEIAQRKEKLLSDFEK